MDILESLRNHNRTLGILIDPEKLAVEAFPAFAKAISHKQLVLNEGLNCDQMIFLVGGSTMEGVDLQVWVATFKMFFSQPVLLFPGSYHQITEKADGLLFLNLISGRNPDYLIEHHVKAAGLLKNSLLQIIPTSYLLINGGVNTAVERVSKTIPMDPANCKLIVDTAYAGQLMGNQLIYLEAGSGAVRPVAVDLIKKVVSEVQVPVIVGGGLKTLDQIAARFDAGASMVVVGTAIERDMHWKG